MGVGGGDDDESNCNNQMTGVGARMPNVIMQWPIPVSTNSWVSDSRQHWQTKQTMAAVLPLLAHTSRVKRRYH